MIHALLGMGMSPNQATHSDAKQLRCLAPGSAIVWALVLVLFPFFPLLGEG